jgi:hypothetical protein
MLLCAAVASVPASAGCIARAPASPAPSPSPTPESPLYGEGEDIYTIDHDGTLFYYFQANRDGTAKAKYETRYDRNLWNTCAQLQIRIPVIQRFPLEGNPFSGLGNIELRYMYAVTSPTFDHSMVVGAAFPTAPNNEVESKDTQLKGFYNVKWKWTGGSLALTNEYDQTIIQPPGAGYTSYYEANVVAPNWSFIDSPAAKNIKFSFVYYGRVLFNRGNEVQDAIGGTVFGNLNDVALSVIDTWGLGLHGLWKYKVEANATARF